MAMPVSKQQIGTGSFIWFADYTISPFQVGAQVVMSGDAGTAILEATLDSINVYYKGEVGTTAANVSWGTVLALSSASGLANFTTPVQAFRASLVTAASVTTIMTVKFVQAGWPS